MLAAFVLASALFAGGSRAALVEVGSIVLRGDAHFVPKKLPRQRRVPIQVEGFFDVRSKTGIPPRLSQVVLRLDPDGSLSPRGLGTCRPAQLERATARIARRRCARAVVGVGRVAAMVQVEGRWLRVIAPLTLLHGPPLRGRPTVLAHAHPTSLPGETYVVSIPISRERGGYVATVEVPEIFNPTGTLVRAEVRIGRPGRRPSFVTARCSDGVIETRGTFTFADGTLIDGPAITDCTPTRPRRAR